MQRATEDLLPLVNSCAWKTWAGNIVEHAAVATDCGRGKAPSGPMASRARLRARGEEARLRNRKRRPCWQMATRGKCEPKTSLNMRLSWLIAGGGKKASSVPMASVEQEQRLGAGGNLRHFPFQRGHHAPGHLRGVKRLEAALAGHGADVINHAVRARLCARGEDARSRNRRHLPVDE